MDDNWMTDALGRADERWERERAARDAQTVRAARFSARFWPTFWAVALGVPVGLWLSTLDFGGLAAALWQTVAERLLG